MSLLPEALADTRARTAPFPALGAIPCPVRSIARLRARKTAAMSGARNTFTYLALSVCGSIAFQIQSVAIAWHVFTLAHRPLDLGFVGLALFLPSFVFALPAGVCADRHDRRRVVTASASTEAAGTLALAGLVVAHVSTVWLYLVILFAIGTARAFEAPAERSILPSIVAPEAYVRTQAAFSSIRQVIKIAGPALGGLLVAFSTVFALGTAAALLFTYALCYGTLTIAPVVRSGASSTWHDAFQGLRFVRSRPIIAGALSLDLFAVLFGGATALLPAFADGTFHVGPTGLGALRAAPAVGAALVAISLARRPLERRVGAVLLASVAGFGLATIAFGLSHDFLLSLVLLAIVGGTDMISVVVRSGLVQLATPDAMRGRVNAVENVFIGASNELGEFESGTLAALVGVVPCVVIGGVGTVAVIALWSALFPALRNANRFDDVTPAPEAR